MRNQTQIYIYHVYEIVLYLSKFRYACIKETATRNIVHIDIKKKRKGRKTGEDGEKWIIKDFHSHLRLDFLDELRFFRGQFLLLLLKKRENDYFSLYDYFSMLETDFINHKSDITRDDNRTIGQDQDFRDEISRKFMAFTGYVSY